jgi:ribosomal protein S18 acetylase RimI-like enzyme
MTGLMTPDPLDNAVWHALCGPLARFAEGAAPALRFAPDVSPFSALPDRPEPAPWHALHELVGPGDIAALFRRPVHPPPGWIVVARMPCVQMTCERLHQAPATQGLAVTVLGDADRADMLRLTKATRPGPFMRRTHELGLYLGLRDRGRLIAMAGERLRVPGATEISAVCTDPAHQRRGLAAALVGELVRRIHARGELAFLHVADDNPGARRVYEALGFTVRARVDALVLRTPA